MLDCTILETGTCFMDAKLLMFKRLTVGQKSSNGDYGVATRTEQSNDCTQTLADQFVNERVHHHLLSKKIAFLALLAGFQWLNGELTWHWQTTTNEVATKGRLEKLTPIQDSGLQQGYSDCPLKCVPVKNVKIQL